MKQRIRTILKHSLLFAAYGFLGVFVTLLVFMVHHLESRPDLSAWHLAELDEEYEAGSDVQTFEQYLSLEDRLFGQLDRLVYEQTGPVNEDFTNRYKRGSFADPGRWETNWNRSFELPAEDPASIVLLLHGLSDSPYSMRATAESLNRSGAHVVALRVPGHGTAPSGLVTTRWQDMAAAVEMVMRDLERRFPGQPVQIVGYSHGAALAVHYTLESLLKEGLPLVDRLVLISPEIGVTKLAAFSVWQARLGYLLGLDKLSWNSILPEYDSFKYGSFAINAGDASYRLTAEIQKQFDRIHANGLASQVPPTLAFTSIVDATVLAPALINNFYDRLEAGGHQLVIYDVNRMAGLKPLYRAAPQVMLDVMLSSPGASFSLSFLTNTAPDSRQVMVKHWAEGHRSTTDEVLDLAWPQDVFSLSHVALPFPEHDPLYGGSPQGFNPGLTLETFRFAVNADVLCFLGCHVATSMESVLGLPATADPGFPFTRWLIMSFQ